MPAKTPIYLKAANNKKGKKFKLRDILSPDMISPPLGDFRHTIHIGKEGQHDVFGDISFLQGNYELLPGNQEKAHMGQFPGHNEFFRANSTSDSMFTETPSPVLKNAISLPTIGGSQALMLPLLSPVTFSSKQESFGPGKLPRLSCEPVVEEKVPEKSSVLENGTVHQADVSWGRAGLHRSPARGGTATPPACPNSTPTGPRRTCLTIPPLASSSRKRLNQRSPSLTSRVPSCPCSLISGPPFWMRC